MSEGKIKVFLAGDSTVAENTLATYPQMGWGQRIGEFFKDNVEVWNFAVNGRSTKSFMDEGRLKQIELLIGKGDFLFIQFGHNDIKPKEDRHTDPFTTYTENLTTYCNVALNAGATPVLINSMHRRKFDETGHIKNTHDQYPEAVRVLAAKLNVPMVDLTKMSKELYESYGDEKSKTLFMWLKKGEYPIYPDGSEDDTHFNFNGAKVMAGLVTDGLKALNNVEINKILK